MRKRRVCMHARIVRRTTTICMRYTCAMLCVYMYVCMYVYRVSYILHIILHILAARVCISICVYLLLLHRSVVYRTMLRHYNIEYIAHHIACNVQFTYSSRCE